MNNEKMITVGNIARELRYLVGGRDLNGFNVSAAGLVTAGPIIVRLKELLDKYDDLCFTEVEYETIKCDGCRFFQKEAEDNVCLHPHGTDKRLRCFTERK